MTAKNRKISRTIDIRDVSGQSGPRIAAFFLVSALEDDNRAFSSAEIAAALGLAYDRVTWGRNIDYVRDLLEPDVLAGPLRGSKGPWRIITRKDC